MIEININLVFTIINLIVLYLLMKKFLFGPILNVMEQRKNMIDQQFASAKDTEEQAYELKGKYEDALKSAKDEIHAYCKTRQRMRQKYRLSVFVKRWQTHRLVQCLTKQRQISGQSRKML